MKVLVTGASGVVGGATVRALLDRGHSVVTLQRGALPEDLASQGVTAFAGSITDEAAVTRAVDGVDAVVHAAARVEVTGPWSSFEEINVTGTRTVYETALQEGVTRFVYVSSPSVAHSGSALIGARATPADPDHARSHYARSKAQAEQWVLTQHSAQMSAVAIRPHLVWGPGDTQLTARIVQRARAGRLVIIGSGAALIDTTYVDNAGTALAAAVERCTDDQVQGRAFIVSNGEPRTVAEMVTRIAYAAGAPGPSRSVPYPVARAGAHVVAAAWERTKRDGEPPITPFVAEQLATAHWFDLAPTREALRWAPAVSIDEGFERLSQWYAR